MFFVSLSCRLATTASHRASAPPRRREALTISETRLALRAAAHGRTLGPAGTLLGDRMTSTLVAIPIMRLSNVS